MRAEEITGLMQSQERVRGWLDSLTLSNVSDSSSHLMQLLAAAAKLDLGPQRHCEFLDTVSETAAVVLDNLEEHFVSANASLDENAASIASIHDDISLALGDGYQRVLRELADAGWLYNKTHVRLWTTAAHRVYFHGFNILRNRRLVGHAPPSGLWLRLNQLHFECDKRGLCDHVAEGPGIEGYPRVSLGHYYKRTLLLQRLRLAEIGREQAMEILRTIGIWADTLVLEPCERGSRGAMSRFRVELDKDFGAIELRPGQSAGDGRHCLLLITEPLDKLFVALLAEMERKQSDRVRLDNGLFVSMLSVGILKAAWALGEDGASHGPPLARSPQEWADSLCVTDIKDTSRRILELLRHLTERQIPAGLRLDYLRHLERPLDHVLANLRKRYGEILFPLHERTERISGLVDDLCQLTVEVWSISLEDWRREGWLFQSLHPRVPDIAIRRIYAFSESILVNRLLMGQAAPEGLWLRLHGLFGDFFLAAREHELLWSGDSGRSRVTIARLHARVILMALSGLQGLRGRQQAELERSLDVWAGYVKFVRGYPSSDEKRYPFCFDLSQDAPPIPTESRIESDAAREQGQYPEATSTQILLDVSELYARLSRLIVAGERELRDTLELNEDTISLDTLRYLREGWRQSPHRSGVRKSTRIEYQGVFSILMSSEFA